jgi:predicted aminopeptidase
VIVYGVPAYSTLGSLPGRWFADPLPSTVVQYPEGEIARLIFHELAHQVAYAKGDTGFNESFATAVERIGSDRWLTERSTPEAREALALQDARQAEFRHLTMDYRDRLAALYGRVDLGDADKRSAKAALMTDLRSDYAVLKRDRWDGYAGYDSWFARANNASFGLLAAYNALVPQFERLFERNGRDFDRFYADVRRLASLSQAQRRAALASEAN